MNPKQEFFQKALPVGFFTTLSLGVLNLGVGKLKWKKKVIWFVLSGLNGQKHITPYLDSIMAGEQPLKLLKIFLKITKQVFLGQTTCEVA